MSLRSLRIIQRSIHLVASVVLAAYVYTPLSEEPWLQNSVRFGTVPVLVVTGFAMWLAPKLLASRRRSKAQAARQ